MAWQGGEVVIVLGLDGCRSHLLERIMQGRRWAFDGLIGSRGLYTLDSFLYINPATKKDTKL